jgi:hypothetical protein
MSGHSPITNLTEQDLAERKRIERLHNEVDFISPIEQTLSKSGKIRHPFGERVERTIQIVIGSLPKNTPIIPRFNIQDLPSSIGQSMCTKTWPKTHDPLHQKIQFLINKCFENVDII